MSATKTIYANDRERNVAKLDVGSVVSSAEFSFGRHPGIVLSTKEEIESSGMVLVVAISSNSSISTCGRPHPSSIQAWHDKTVLCAMLKKHK